MLEVTKRCNRRKAEVSEPSWTWLPRDPGGMGGKWSSRRGLLCAFVPRAHGQAGDWPG